MALILLISSYMRFNSTKFVLYPAHKKLFYTRGYMLSVKSPRGIPKPEKFPESSWTGFFLLSLAQQFLQKKRKIPNNHCYPVKQPLLIKRHQNYILRLENQVTLKNKNKRIQWEYLTGWTRTWVTWMPYTELSDF